MKEDKDIIPINNYLIKYVILQFGTMKISKQTDSVIVFILFC